jgi:hypothetical protein
MEEFFILTKFERLGSAVLNLMMGSEVEVDMDVEELVNA